MNAPIKTMTLETITIEANTWADQQAKEGLALVPVVRESCKIQTSADAEHWNKMLKGFQRCLDEVEKQRKWLGDPAYQTWKRINDAFRPAKEPLESIIGAIKAELGAYGRREAERTREAYQIAATAMQAGETQIMTQALAIADQPVAQLEGTSTRNVWRARVVNEGLVPRDYLMVDMTKINAVARDAAADGPAPVVPGVVFELDSIVTSRR